MLKVTSVCVVALLIFAGVPMLYAQDVNRQSSYYGIPISESGVVFLLDISGSMEDKGEGRPSVWRKAAEIAAEKLKQTEVGDTKIGEAAADRILSETTKLGAARRELFKALRSLSGLTEFTIITFGKEVKEWPRGMQKARGEPLQHAKVYALTLSADGQTPMAEAVELAFAKSRVRTIFLVSDGRPTTGEVLNLVERLQSERGAEKVVLNTVGVGKDQDKSLLCSLAKANHGVFVSDGVVTCTSNPCPNNPEIMTYFRPTNPFFHEFTEPQTEICTTRQRGCTPELVYEVMTSQVRFGAPTEDTSRPHNCQEFTLRVPPLKRRDPITIVLDSDNLTWMNYTREGHIFHPGRITRTVVRRGNSVMVETHGEGVGDLGKLNKEFGPGLFRDVDDALKAAVAKRLSSN